MEFGIIIKNVIIIAVIITVAFLSQQPNFRHIGEKVSTQGTTYWVNISGWFKTNVWPKLGREVEAIGSSTTREITVQKNNFVENIWGNFEKYILKIFSNNKTKEN